MGGASSTEGLLHVVPSLTKALSPPPLRWVCKEWLSTNGMKLVRVGRMTARFTIMADTGVCEGHTQPRYAVQRPIAFWGWRRNTRPEGAWIRGVDTRWD